MTPLTLWHNPRCSTSRKALALLTAHHQHATIRHYLIDPPGPDDLTALARALNRPLRDLIRTTDPAYKAAGLGPDSDDAALLGAMTAHPALIQRPILIRGNLGEADTRAVIGRPPEAILALLPQAF